MRLEELEDRSTPALFSVTNALDIGLGSLRQAILDANANVGTDAIAFNIAGSGVQTISLASALPTITEAVTIDATTQTGWINAPIIELRGDGAGAGANGFTIISSGSTIRGFAINRFGGSGVLISGAGAVANAIEGNFIGTSSSGTGASGNSTGVTISAGATNNTIGGTTAGARNVISGNTGTGVTITGNSTTANVVAGNYIGVNAAGTAALANAGDGVRIQTNAHANTIGGAVAGAGNVISGNASDGVEITGANVHDNIVQGNFIGTNAAGTAAVGNTSNGVEITLGATNITVGGTAAGARNVISGNTGNGITITGTGTTGNVVAGNYIGTNAAGTAAIGNAVGIQVISGSNTMIGGTDLSALNVISGNRSSGIVVTNSTGLTGSMVTNTFDNYTGGNQNALQPGTGLPLSFGGSIPGWSASGGNAVHAVNFGSSNFAVTLYNDNVLTLNSGINANAAGVQYRVAFNAGPSVYTNLAQATQATDGVVVSLLRDDNSVLATYTVLPGAWVTGPVPFGSRLRRTMPDRGDSAGRLTIFRSSRPAIRYSAISSARMRRVRRRSPTRATAS